MIVKAKDIKLIIVDIVDPITELCVELEERFAGIDSVVIKNDRLERTWSKNYA